MKASYKILLLLTAAAALCPIQGCSEKSSGSDSSSAEISASENSDSSEDSPADSSESGSDASQISQSDSTAQPAGTDQVSSGSDSQNQSAQTSVIVGEDGSTRIVPASTELSSQAAPTPGSTSADSQNQTEKYDITVSVDRVKAKAGQERVPISIRLSNNSGFATGGLTVDFDPELHPVTTDSAGTIAYQTGEQMKGLMTYGTSNEENGNHLIAFACFNQIENITANDILMTFYMNIPADAQSGKEYLLKLNIDSIKNIDKKALNIEAIDGSITIE